LLTNFVFGIYFLYFPLRLASVILKIIVLKNI
jgi:hypothetical protein